MTALATAVWLLTRDPHCSPRSESGKDGHAFQIYKFRTMVVDAEQRRVQLQASNDSDGVLFKTAPGSAGHPDRRAAEALVDRRAAAALQRVPRRDVTGGPAPGPA